MNYIVEFSYLLAAVLFILGIKLMTHVKSARKGNMLAAVGMFVAVLATLIDMNAGDASAGIPASIGWPYIIAGIIVGGIIGVLFSKKVKMTGMPELVAILNGFGGGASVLVALSYIWAKGSAVLSLSDIITVMLSVLIGAVTFTGSMVAFAKLKGLITGRPIVFKGNNLLNAALFIVVLASLVWTVTIRSDISTVQMMLIAVTIISSILGILLVTPIGGADMPVVISLLNAYSGLAATATGFVLGNSLLIITGSLVGASGIILSNIMCKAMNRSLVNVLFGGFGQGQQKESKEGEYQNIKECSVEEAALILESAKSVIMVPGYGMAVAQAQHAVQELAAALEKRGANVLFAIHPVAGRMPGHMNVLLAEADVPYEKLKEMDEINSEFRQADVAIVIGANDVVNPAATQNKGSPIYGMPILNVHEAKTVIVIKRSLGAGFAGIKNLLFEYPNTLMLFGDAKEMLTKLTREVNEL